VAGEVLVENALGKGIRKIKGVKRVCFKEENSLKVYQVSIDVLKDEGFKIVEERRGKKYKTITACREDVRVYVKIWCELLYGEMPFVPQGIARTCADIKVTGKKCKVERIIDLIKIKLGEKKKDGGVNI